MKEFSLKPGQRLIVETEAESLEAKKSHIGRSGVVSDRDIFTLDFYLNLFAMQEKGLRLVQDEAYVFYLNGLMSSKSYERAVSLLSAVPDFFLEPSLKQIVLDYLKEKAEAKFFIETLKDAETLIDFILNQKVAPRSFTKLLINELEIKKGDHIYKDFLESLPLSFQDHYLGSGGGVLDRPSLNWATPLEFVDSIRSSEVDFKFVKFENQLDEVRFALKTLSTSEGAVFLYPESQGYESLFYMYQMEFFKEQRVFKEAAPQTLIPRLLDSIKCKLSTRRTHYEDAQQNSNLIKNTQIDEAAYTFSEILNFYKEKPLDYDINFMSEIQRDLPSDLRVGLDVWYDVFLRYWNKSCKKLKKIKTDLGFLSYQKFLRSDSVKSLYILGWGEPLNKRLGERLFSPEILSALDFDLGIKTPSLYTTHLHQVFKNPLLYESNIEKYVSSYAVSSSGKSLSPDVFRVLNEEHGAYSSVGRELFLKDKAQERKLIHKKLSKLSASALSTYETCPYKYYLERHIGLRNEEEEDFYLSALEEGRLLHKALEILAEKTFSESGLREMVDEYLQTGESEFESHRKVFGEKISKKLWAVLKEEKEHLDQNELKVHAVEKSFEIFISDKEKKISLKRQNESDLVVRGVVDRIDVAKNGLALLYDYKRGGTGVSSLKRYKGEKLNAQLFLYCIAADLKAFGERLETVGFQFINLKDYKRTGGFVLKDFKNLGLIQSFPQGSDVEVEVYEEKINLFLNLLWDVLDRLRAGEFMPNSNPKLAQACQDCEWKGVCKKSQTFV